MKNVTLFFLLAFLSACTGLFPTPYPSEGKIVTPEYLSKYEGGGSISTIWYRGSDDKYHYFVHLVKIKTKYRIRKEDLTWEIDFPLKSRPSMLIDGELRNYIKTKTVYD